MQRSLFFFMLSVLLLPLCAYSQNSPAPAAIASAPSAAAPDAPELTKLLKDFLAGASTNDITMHDRFWADDLIYTSALGRRKGKADIMRELREQDSSKPADNETASYSAEDIRIQQYGTTAIVAFRLVAKLTNDKKTEISHYLNTGTFLKRGKWQAVAWQATKMPAETEPKK